MDEEQGQGEPTRKAKRSGEGPERDRRGTGEGPERDRRGTGEDIKGKKKRGSGIEPVPVFSVEFILQNGEIGDFHQSYLASVLRLPLSEYG